MKTKKRLITAVCVIIGVLFVAGITAIAVSTYGTSSDPLVTLSYLEQTVKPDIMNELNDSVNTAKSQLTSDFEKKIAEVKKDGGGTSSGTVGSGDAFVTVSLTKRQVITCAPGTEILVRSGSATAYGGASPRLVDETDGTDLASAGAALTNNHMYIVPTDGHGIRAASDSASLLVRGNYTVHSDL